MKFSESLKKNKDFQTVYRQGKSYANKYLVLYIMENQTEKNRIGISVSKSREQCCKTSPYKIDKRELSTSRRMFPKRI